MNRRYYDLRAQAEDGSADPSFSFAEQMCARGYIVAALDHLGLGDSTKPEDGWQLTAEVLVQANANATAQLLERLAQRRVACRCAGVATSCARASVSAIRWARCSLVLQQHAAQQHEAIVVLGFSTRSLPEYLPPALKRAWRSGCGSIAAA